MIGKSIVVVFGTRPEAIKMCPVVQELKKHKEIRTIVAVTGQHRQMLDQVLAVFGVVPDYDLSIMAENQTLFDVTERVMSGMRIILEKEKPDIVMVHGDTTTSFAAALAAYYMEIKIAHVEAGLRTYDAKSPYPEEFNRHAVGIMCDYNFAPTEQAKKNLTREGKRLESIWVTGNTVIDALKTTIRDDYHHPELDWCAGNRMILITAHRRENLGDPMRNVFRAIKRVIDEHDDVRAIYPVHKNPKVREVCNEVFGDDERIHLIEPLDVLDFHNFMNASYLILTDSGGIQEEAPSLGKPVLVLRSTSERPEAIESGTAILAGTLEEDVYREFSLMLDDYDRYEKMKKKNNPYGDGFASRRIVEIMLESLGLLK